MNRHCGMLAWGNSRPLPCPLDEPAVSRICGPQFDNGTGLFGYEVSEIGLCKAMNHLSIDIHFCPTRRYIGLNAQAEAFT